VSASTCRLSRGPGNESAEEAVQPDRQEQVLEGSSPGSMHEVMVHWRFDHVNSIGRGGGLVKGAPGRRPPRCTGR
jgi:hypothetical protein